MKKDLFRVKHVVIICFLLIAGSYDGFAGDTDTSAQTSASQPAVKQDTVAGTEMKKKGKDKDKPVSGFKAWYQNQKEEGLSTTTAKSEKKWYESFAIRGYVQFRYNRLAETNEKLKCEQCDKSWGEGGGFFLRRTRIIFYGQIGKHVYFYIQPDFASSASSTNLHFAQLRDAYFDLGIGKHNEFRFRLGQSKVPFGFENMQSSQNRLPLDRADGMNSAVSNERDIGVFFYWAPEKNRKLYSDLVKDGLKGSGDYGNFGLGIYNGQTANKPELNKAPHVVARFSYPVKIKDQVIEPGVQGYSGKYVIATDMLSKEVGYLADRSYWDQRVAGTFVLYPKPFGIQAEYNFGRGPEYNPATDSVEIQKLHGGYVTFSYFLPIKKQILFPYFRMQYYDGGKKHELDARSYTVQEYELGFEYQPVKQFEFVMAYVYSDRRFEDHAQPVNHQKGHLIRMQAQINF